MLTMKRAALTLAVAAQFALPLCAMQGAHAATFTTQQQGMQQWKALNGKLIMVTGSYHDTTSYKRSLTFYFEEKPGGEWLHVPVIESEVDRDLTFFSVSKGDETIEDAVLTTQGADSFLIVAEKKGGNVLAHWYKFAAAGADYPDGPAFMFKPAGTKTYAKNAAATVEDVLQKEARLKPAVKR